MSEATIYDIRQTTTYSYGSVVPYARHLARMTPVTRQGQRVLSAALSITPEPAERRDGGDFFGNRTVSFLLDDPHDRLEVIARSRVAVRPQPAVHPDSTPRTADIAMAARASRDPGPLSPAQFLFASRAVGLDEGITMWAARSFSPGRAFLEAAIELMQRIHDDFAYDPGATDAQTAPAAVFESRRGVCQDFAHVMIAALRGHGLPAAYVSGYLRTDPPAGQPRLVGADATHAWVQVWCGPQAGWVGLDPTNAIPAGSDHIVLAVGRDYADVAPLDGVIVASGVQALAVGVDVMPLGRRRRAPASGRTDGTA